MTEPEVALAFTADTWVEELHRHLADHGGARVRALVVDPDAIREESYDVLVAGHRWVGLTHALIADVHARGRVVLGVFDSEEHASRMHLSGVGVDALIESDAAPDAFVRAIVALAGTREDGATVRAPRPEPRAGRIVVVGGAPGSGRTEVAARCATALSGFERVVLVDADDIAPAVAQRLGLPLEPNLRTAIDAAEHGLGSLDGSAVRDERARCAVVAGLPSSAAWAQVRPGEVMRVVEHFATETGFVVVDGAGSLEDLAGTGPRGRHATARALVAGADALVAVCDASPHGVTRLLSWIVDARQLAPATPLFAVVNRTPTNRFQRAELYDEIMTSAPLADAVFAPYDERVRTASWDGVPTPRGAFTKALDALVERIAVVPVRADTDASVPALEEAS